MIEGGSKTGREKHANWRQDVMYAARDYICEHPMPPLDGPVQVTVVFRFPQLTGDKYRTMHSTKPDADKLLRATFDALVAAGMIVDDARITAGSWTKLYARPPMTPGATITVEPLGTTEASMREALKAAAKAARKA
jgi:Holliday junction resolvase RusA-like endonuclease